MARSYRKNLNGGIAVAKNDRLLKDTSNSALRSLERDVLKSILKDSEIEPNLPVNTRELVNTWSGSKDGKRYFGNDNAEFLKKFRRK